MPRLPRLPALATSSLTASAQSARTFSTSRHAFWTRALRAPAAAASTAASAPEVVPAPTAGQPPPRPAGHIRCASPERKAMVDEMLRVDHAGEVGAVQIYAGQLWALRGTTDVAMLQAMKAGEEVHLRTLSREMAARRVRPTALLPLWHAAGWALGACTALLGREAAMQCTVAVETVIGEHYNDQIREVLARGLGAEEAALADIFRRHRDEELAHLDAAAEQGAARAPFAAALGATIKAGCRAAIAVARVV